MTRTTNRVTRGSVPAGIAQVRQTLALPDLQLSHVTVFTDRAELVRTITPVFKAGEIVEVLLENVSSAIDRDSVRYVVLKRFISRQCGLRRNFMYGMSRVWLAR